MVQCLVARRSCDAWVSPEVIGNEMMMSLPITSTSTSAFWPAKAIQNGGSRGKGGCARASLSSCHTVLASPSPKDHSILARYYGDTESKGPVATVPSSRLLPARHTLCCIVQVICSASIACYWDANTSGNVGHCGVGVWTVSLNWLLSADSVSISVSFAAILRCRLFIGQLEAEL